MWRYLSVIGVMCLIPFAAIAKEPLKLIGHYMQWFDYRRENGRDCRSHWEWNGKSSQHSPERFTSDLTRDIYSVLYPRIGIYDSTDPTVIDYQILSAKAAGISAYVVDWYGPDRKFEQLLRHAAAAGDFQAAVCYEEKTCFPDWAGNRAGIKSREDAIQSAVKDFQYLKTQFVHPAYYRRNGKPVVMVFGHVYPRPRGWGAAQGEWRFSPEEWRRILREAGCADVELLLQQFRYSEQGFNSFLWRHPEVFYPRGRKLMAQHKIEFFIGTVSPGFDDRGVDGWGNGSRIDPNLGLERLEDYIALADTSGCDTVQVVTWNDYAEGTCVEPSYQYGQLYLERLVRWHAERNGYLYFPGNTILPYQWFVLTKKFGAEATASIKTALLRRDYSRAKGLIGELAAKMRYRMPSVIGRGIEFPLYEVRGASASGDR